MRIYVSTYAKYAAGNLTGKWLDLEDYSDKETFIEACRELHKDEQDPEFMFQDFEDVPSDTVSESSIDPAIWDFIELDEHERDVVEAYMDATGTNLEEALSEAQDRLIGYGMDRAEVAEEFLEGTGTLDEIPEHLRHYFDFDAYARDMEIEGYSTRLESTYYLFSGC